MAQTIKIRCNGHNKHVNKIDLDKILKPELIVRGKPPSLRDRMPERLVLRCQHCTEGKVVITREMVEDFIK